MLQPELLPAKQQQLLPEGNLWLIDWLTDILATISLHPKALATKEYNKFMIDFILEYYNPERAEKHWKPVDFNPQLMDAAKKEAERLASLNTLTAPAFKFVQSYQAYSYRYFKKRKSVGYRKISFICSLIFVLNVKSAR
jgi:hypothetical protein